MFNKLFSKTNILLVVILLLAAFLRLYRIGDYINFLGDEGRDVLVVYNILHGHLTLLGPTASVGGFFLGPIYYYFMTPFLWLWNYNPTGPAVMVALFGIATVWMTYSFTKKIFGTTAALIAASLYAVSPLVVTYSRSSWNPNPLPFFSLLTVYLLYKAIDERRNKYFVFSGISLGIAMQLHYLSTFLATIVFFFILGAYLYKFFCKELRAAAELYQTIISYLFYFVGFLIGFSPFLLFEVRHDFANIRSILMFVFHSKETGAGANFFTILQNVYVRIFGRLIAAYPSPDQYVHFNTTLLTIWYLFVIAIVLSSTIFVLYQLKKMFGNQKKFLPIFLISLWLFLGVYLFGFYKKEIYDYYFAFLFPVPFVVVGGMLASISNKLIGKLVASSVFIVLFVACLFNQPINRPPNMQMQQVEGIARFIYDKTDNKPFNFALITGGNSDHAYRYFFTLWGHPPVTIQNVEVDPQRKSVTSQLFVVCETLPCYPLGDSLWEIAGFGRAEIVGKWDVSVLQVYKLVHYTGK